MDEDSNDKGEVENNGYSDKKELLYGNSNVIHSLAQVRETSCEGECDECSNIHLP